MQILLSIEVNNVLITFVNTAQITERNLNRSNSDFVHILVD